MNVQDIVNHDFGVVPDTGSLRQAAVLMREKESDVLLVQQGERTVGTLSHRDLALKGYGEGRDPDKDVVTTVMTQHLASCELETDLTTALRMMIEQDLDTLVLGEPPEKITGLVTRMRALEELAQPGKESGGTAPERAKQVSPV